MSRVSVITGGAGGMGLATAKIVGGDHTVVLCDVRQDRLDTAAATLESLGETMGISKERVRQIESRAMEKLKSALVKANPAFTAHSP